MRHIGLLSCALLAVPGSAYAEALCQPSGEGQGKITHELFPERGTAGHVAALQVQVLHGKGETLLPHGVKLDTDSNEAKSLRARGFGIPHENAASDAGTAGVLREERGGEVLSTLTVPLLLLPKEPGTQAATLPELPLSLVQASGQVLTLCTKPHAITVVDPTANVPEAAPRDNSMPLRQREHWRALELVLWSLLGALVCLVLGAFAYRAWSKRPKPVPPPPPPRPPWEIALEALAGIRANAANEAPGHVIDRVTDVLRTYLGDIYDFDGLESTTEEVLEQLRKRGAQTSIRSDVANLLLESDLVKFASAEAHERMVAETLEHVRALVHRTMPEGTKAGGAP